MKMEQKMQYHVVLSNGGHGWLTVTVPALPGCVSQGRTRAEALSNVAEAITGYLESLVADGEEVPEDEELLEIATVRTLKTNV
jgi:predicted RNase H-like HicB family nuclease